MNNSSANNSSAVGKRKRWNRKAKIWIVFLLILVPVVWVLGDYTYSRVVQKTAQRWEDSVERDEEGVQLDAQPFTLEAGSTALLLVHGFNDTPRAWDLIAPALHQKGYTIRAVRMAGFGVPVSQMQSCTWRDWVESVSEEAARLRSKPSVSKVIIVGHSLGGAVTLGVLKEHADLFDGVVLLAPAIDVANHRSPIFPTRFWRRLSDYLLRFSTVYQSPYDRNDCRDPAYRNPEYKPPFSTRNIVQQSFLLMDRNQENVKQIELPVLMVLTRDDQVTDWVAAETFFDAIASRNKNLKFYDRSGHALTVDYDWSKIVDDIDQFTESLVSPQRTETSQ